MPDPIENSCREATHLAFPKSKSFWQRSEDWHTAGETFRIVDDLPPGSLIEGISVAEQRLHILQTHNHPLDTLRRSLSHEPRGHADMYGGFITPANNSGAHFGVLFWQREGFSTACGHGTIALGYWAASKGIVESIDDGCVEVVIDVPSGRIVARLCYKEKEIAYVDFMNVPSYQISKAVPVEVALETGTAPIDVDLSYGGAVYAFVDAADVGLAIEPRNWRHFIEIQQQIKIQMSSFRHLGQYDLYGVCFFEAVEEHAKWVRQRNVVVFANGQIDRSPCGSGTSARLAIL